MTRKLYFFVLMACVMLVSCGSDDEAAPEGTLTIVRSDLIFGPQARTGQVEVNSSAGAVSAELNSSWCKATVSGSVVSVSVTDNTDFEGRTALLTISAGTKRLQLPVQQRGMALGSLDDDAANIANAGGHLSFYIRHDLPFTLSTDEDWIHASMEGDSLLIDIDANDNWYVRRGVLSYECAGYSGELEITQYDMDKVLGEYMFTGMSSTQGFRFLLSEKNGQFYMTFFTDPDWKNSPVPVTFDRKRCELVLHSATTIVTKTSASTGTTTYAYYFYDENGNLATSTEAKMKARIYYNPFAYAGVGSHYGKFEDTGEWGGNTLYGFSILLIHSLLQTPIVQFNEPYIFWLGPGTDL